MTDSKTYQVAGAEVIVTATVYPETINLSLTVDISALDSHLPDHSPHNLMQYLNLPGYNKRQSYWWCKVYREVKVKTGSQARRVIKHALAQIDDAVTRAQLDRDRRLAERTVIWAAQS